TVCKAEVIRFGGVVVGSPPVEPRGIGSVEEFHHLRHRGRRAAGLDNRNRVAYGRAESVVAIGADSRGDGLIEARQIVGDGNNRDVRAGSVRRDGGDASEVAVIDAVSSGAA